MKKSFPLSLIATAIISTLPATASAIDGWDYSGAEARANAKQLNYFTLNDDFGNIWVNPALAAQHRNQVRLTITDEDRQGINRADDNPGSTNTTNSGGAGGALYGLGASSTVGLYIGRRSTSDLGDALTYANYTGAPNLTGDTDNFSDTDYNPQSQFDLFYALSLPGFDIGVRLNYQAEENQQALGEQTNVINVAGTAGDRNNITAEGYVDLLEQNSGAQVGSPSANLTQALGQHTEAQSNNGIRQWDASEVNVSVGFNLPELGLDGAIQFGSASGEQLRTRSSTGDALQWTRLTGSESDRLLDLGNGETQVSDRTEIDDGSSMGIALRYQIIDTNSENLMISLRYHDQDYSGLFASEQTSSSETIGWEENDASTNFQETGRNRNHSTEQWSGRYTDERETLGLTASYQIQPAPNTRVTIAGGFMQQSRDMGHWTSRDEDMTTAEETPTGEQTTSWTLYNNNYGTISRGEQTMERSFAPLVIAVEQGITERWTLRGSIAKDLYSHTEFALTNFTYNGVDLAERRDPDPTAQDQSTQRGPDSLYLTGSSTAAQESTWSDEDTTVRLGFGYQRNQLSIDAVFSATLDRLFTSDHKVLEDSKFARVTLGYRF